MTARRARAAAWLATGVAAAAVVAWLWERGPNLAPETRRDLGADGQVSAVGQYRTSLLQATAAIGGVVALAYTARNYRLSHRGQTTDRFTKALERLGSADMYVRIGAVYALEQVLRDSPEQHADIITVLVEFIRAHTALTLSVPIRRETTTHRGVHAITLTALPDSADHPDRPHPDISAALTVLGRWPYRGRPTAPLDLTAMHLTNASLDRADLSGALLDEANLTDAWLSGANLANAKFGMVANLAGARFLGADLTGADLVGADLTRAGFDDADLTGARFDAADLTRARLIGADLTGASFNEADLTGTNLVGTNLSANQANSALHADLAVLPPHLVWDLALKRVREATAKEAAATETRYRKQYPWLYR